MQLQPTLSRWSPEAAAAMTMMKESQFNKYNLRHHDTGRKPWPLQRYVSTIVAILFFGVFVTLFATAGCTATTCYTAFANHTTPCLYNKCSRCDTYCPCKTCRLATTCGLATTCYTGFATHTTPFQCWHCCCRAAATTKDCLACRFIW